MYNNPASALFPLSVRHAPFYCAISPNCAVPTEDTSAIAINHVWVVLQGAVVYSLVILDRITKNIESNPYKIYKIG
jgi:hypothetical protein